MPGYLLNWWSAVVRQDSACLSVVDSAADIQESSHRATMSLADGIFVKDGQQYADGTLFDVLMQGAPLPACNKVPSASIPLT